MKTIFINLALLGLVWKAEPTVEVTTNLAHAPTTTAQPLDGEDSTTIPINPTNRPVSERNIPLDLSQRLFYADHDDSQFNRKTLDLSGLDLTGEDVMRILHSLNVSILTSVARLDLSRNRVFSLPQRVWPLEMEYKLLELRLDHNQLYAYESLELWITRFELLRLLSLKKLSLAHCGLTSQTSQWQLEYPSTVTSLDLSYNGLVEVPASVSKLAHLEHLNMSHNNMGYLTGYGVSNLDKLRTLDLSYNKLVAMFDDPLAKLSSLETVHLDHNELSEPPKLYQFKGSYQPRICLYLSGNRFPCGSDLKDLMDTQRVEIVDKSNATCLDGYQVEHLLVNMTANFWSYQWGVVREKLSVAKVWVGDNLPRNVAIYQFLVWMLFGLTLTLMAFYYRKKKTTAPSDAPYDILSDGAPY